MTQRHTPIDESRLPGWLMQNRNFVCLWAAYGVSALGDHLSEPALLTQLDAMNRDDFTRLQALMQFGFFAPFVLAAPFAGWWADRFSRKWTMIVSDLLRASVIFSLIWTVPALIRHGFGDWSVVFPLAAVGLLAAFFSPARQALLPTLIRDDQIVRANAVMGALAPVASIVGYVTGASLAKNFNPELNYKLNAVGFVLSAVFVSTISLRWSRAVAHAPEPGLMTPIAAGFRYVWTHRRTLQVILLGGVFWAVAGALMSVLPVIVRDSVGGDMSDISIFRGILGIGMIAGAVIMTIFGPTVPIPLAVLASVTGGAFWLFVLAVFTSLKSGAFLTGFALFMIGVHGSGLLVTVNATLQRFVPDSRRGRVFGVSDMLLVGAMAASSAALGIPHFPSIDKWVVWIVIATGAGLLGAAVVAWRTYRASETGISPLLSIMIKLVDFYTAYWCRLQRVGPCTVPRHGPAIVAANHRAGIDPILILATSPHRKPSFVVEESYYRLPVMRSLMSLIDCIPVRRSRPGKSTIEACLRKLESGGVLGVFPQGGFETPNGEPREARAGVGMLALRSGAPVIPVFIGGQNYSESAAIGFLKRHSARVVYGKPVPLEDLMPHADEKSAQEEAAARIMAAIRALEPRANAAPATGRKAVAVAGGGH
jgi:1-acyl-sn-glycerol-3-phosphate acyltransferase